jgi:PadR family transcriptional regulator PadR
MALIRGTLDLLVLKSLSWAPLHAFEIAQWLEQRSDGELTVEDAALIQALHRMEERKLLTAAWGTTDNNRKARYYSLTPAGRTYLKRESEVLRRSVAALTDVLDASSAALGGLRGAQ